MIIIIEGVDNAGKSDLADYLVDKYEYGYHRCDKAPVARDTAGIVLEFKEMYNILSKIPKGVVCDRAHLSEFVYSQLWRGGATLSFADLHDIEIYLTEVLQVPSILIHLHASERAIIDRCQRNKEELLKNNEVSRCLSLFEDACNSSSVLWQMSINTENSLPQETFAKVEQCLSMIDRRSSYFLNNPAGNI